ncbi:MAG: DivIVA domain-containing protein [Desulfobacterales bacterium]|nr:DivIVA domain-containing protein [Desulfobacterales bacterium]
MALTPLDIQQQRFRTAFRGYETKEVETFLEQAAAAFEELQRETLRLNEELTRGPRREIEEFKRREGTDQARPAPLPEGSRPDAGKRPPARPTSSWPKRKTRPKRSCSTPRAGSRSCRSPIAELRRQRIQAEAEITFVIESHRKLLEAGRSEPPAGWTSMDDKLKILKTANS